jgi:hypothetical protein
MIYFNFPEARASRKAAAAACAPFLLCIAATRASFSTTPRPFKRPRVQHVGTARTANAATSLLHRAAAFSRKSATCMSGTTACTRTLACLLHSHHNHCRFALLFSPFCSSLLPPSPPSGCCSARFRPPPFFLQPVTILPPQGLCTVHPQEDCDCDILSRRNSLGCHCPSEASRGAVFHWRCWR